MTTVLTGSNGGIAVVDGDGGSSPAYAVNLNPGKTAAAGGHYAGNDEYTYFKRPDLRTSDEVEQALLHAIEHNGKDIQLCAEVVQMTGRQVDTQGAQIRLLQVQVADAVTRLLAAETELAGLRQNVAGMEHRCTNFEAQAAEWDRIMQQRKEAQG